MEIREDISDYFVFEKQEFDIETLTAFLRGRPVFLQTSNTKIGLQLDEEVALSREAAESVFGDPDDWVDMDFKMGSADNVWTDEDVQEFLDAHDAENFESFGDHGLTRETIQGIVEIITSETDLDEHVAVSIATTLGEAGVVKNPDEDRISNFENLTDIGSTLEMYCVEEFPRFDVVFRLAEEGYL